MRIRMKGYSPSVRNRRVRRHARRHAKKGVKAMAQWVVQKLIGAKEILDVINNPVHKRVYEESKPDPRIPEWEAEKRAVEEARTHHASRPMLWIAFVFLLVVEFAGIAQLLASQGMENPERAIVALAGSCILFYLTYKASQQALKQQKSIWFFLLMAAIALLVLAVGLLRRDETATEDTSAWLNFASAVFMTIITLGPGLLAKEVFAALIPIEQLAKNRRRLIKDIKAAEQKSAKAKEELRQIELAEQWWEQESAQITSTYNLEYVEAGGILPETTPNPYAHVAQFPHARVN